MADRRRRETDRVAMTGVARAVGRPTASHSDAVEVLEFGSPIPPRLGRRVGRRLAATAAGALVVVLSVVVGAGLRDHLQTVNSQRVDRAVKTLEADSPGLQVRQQVTDGGFGGLRTDPGHCVELLDPALLNSNLLGSIPGVPAQGRGRQLSFQESTTADQVELGVVEYPTPDVARGVVRSLSQQASECGSIAVLPRQEGDGGVRLDLEDLHVSWWAWIDANHVAYQLHSQDTWAFPDTSVVVRRFGNVVVFGPSPTQTDAAMSLRVDRLISHLQ